MQKGEWENGRVGQCCYEGEMFTWVPQKGAWGSPWEKNGEWQRRQTEEDIIENVLLSHVSQDWRWDSQSPPVSFPFPLLTSGGTLQTRLPYLLTVKINFRADQLIGKMWINYCAWMTRKFDLPLKLNLSKWMMGRNWKGRRRWGWVGEAGWYSSEFTERPQTRICQRWGVLISFDRLYCPDWQKSSAVLCCFRNGQIEDNCQVFEVCACGAGPHSCSNLKIIKYFTTAMTLLGLEPHQIGGWLFWRHQF